MTSIREKIASTLCEQPSIFFVQVGANDGLQGDPIHTLIVEDERWHGIFIEPVVYLFRRLKNTYHGNTRFIFENTAIGKYKEMRKFYYVAEELRRKIAGELPFWYDQVGSFSRSHIIKSLGSRVEPYIVEEEIVTAPLSDVLFRNNVNTIDVLVVDAEGFDYQVLTQLDFLRYRPLVILYEHDILTEEERFQAEYLLISHGYSLVSYASGDTLATLED